MKAAVYEAPNKIVVKDVPIPTLDEGEALIRVKYNGICGTDLTIVAGKHPRARPPLIPGHEILGKVVEIRTERASESPIQVGDKVTVRPLLPCRSCLACRSGNIHVCRSLKLLGIDLDGGLAEYVKSPIEIIHKVPRELDDDTAAVIEPLSVAVHATSRRTLKKIDSALVLGAGTIGTLVAMVLREEGVKNLMVAESNTSRLNMAKNSGFTTLDASEPSYVEEVLSRTDGEGADVVFECTGSKGAAADLARLVRVRGEIVAIGVYKERPEVDMTQIAFKEITVTGSRVYTKSDFDSSIALADRGTIPLAELVTHKVELDETERGFELMMHPEESLKILIRCE